MPSLVENTVEMMRSKAYSKRLTLKVVADVQHTICKVDKIRIVQILINLLSNAIKFSHDDGSVYITLMMRKIGDNMLSVKLLVKD